MRSAGAAQYDASYWRANQRHACPSGARSVGAICSSGSIFSPMVRHTVWWYVAQSGEAYRVRRIFLCGEKEKGFVNEGEEPERVCL